MSERSRPDASSGSGPRADDSTSGRRPGRGRRPAAQVREEVLDSAATLLFEAGMGAVTFDKVAKHAGCSKMTLYRWWPSPGALAVEAYFAATAPTLEFPDTNDVRADLTRQIVAFIGLVTSGDGRVIAQLIGAAQQDPEVARVMRDAYTLPRRRLATDRIAKAQREGQLRRDVDPEHIVDQLWGACYLRLLLPGREALTESAAAAFVDNLLNGVIEPVTAPPAR